MKKIKAPKNLEEAIEIIVKLQQENAKLKELLGVNLEDSLAIKASQENYFLNQR